MIKYIAIIVIGMSIGVVGLVNAGEDKEMTGNQGYVFGGPLVEAQQRTEAIEEALDGQVYTQKGVVHVQPIKVIVTHQVEEVKRPTIKVKDVTNGIKKIDDWVQKNLW